MKSLNIPPTLHHPPDELPPAIRQWRLIIKGFNFGNTVDLVPNLATAVPV